MSKEVNEERAPQTVTDVKEMLTKHSNGEIQRTIQNCITILQNDHVLADAIRLNLFTQQVQPDGIGKHMVVLQNRDAVLDRSLDFAVGVFDQHFLHIFNGSGSTFFVDFFVQ